MRRIAIIVLLFAAAIARASDDAAVLTVVLTRDDGQSVKDLEVRVDDVTKKTDADGMARFVVRPGQHIIHLSSGQPGLIFIAAGQKARWTTVYRICVCEWVTIPRTATDVDDAPIDTPLVNVLGGLPLGRTIVDVARLAPGSQPERLPGPSDVLFVDGIEGNELHRGGPSMALPLDFFQAVNVISGATPAEFGHASGTLILATPRRIGTGIGLFAYVQPPTHDEHSGVRFDHQPWDAGITFGNRWLFAAYDHAAARDDLRFKDIKTTAREGVDAFLVRGELHRERLAVIGEVAGDPTTSHFREDALTSSLDRGLIAGSLEALALVHDTTMDVSLSHREPRQQGNFLEASGDRGRIDVARDFGAHLLRAGAEREQLRESVHFHIPGGSHSNTTAAYVTDMWQLGTRFTANAGIRGEAFDSDAIPTGITRSHFSDRVLSPRASLVWLWTPDTRLFGTYAKSLDELPLPGGGTYIVPPQHSEETTVGLERIGYGFGGGVRLIHRRDGNAVLLTSNFISRPEMVMRASYRYGYDGTAPYTRRHNLIGEWSRPFGWHVQGGAIVQWMSSTPLGDSRLPAYFSADLHAGVRVRKAEFVLDVFNAFGNQSPVLDPHPPFAIPVSYLASAWQPPRSIRFGIRAAL